MRTVGLKTLKNRLSEYVRLAQHGETVLISDRDRVVAELVPPQETRSPTVSDAVLADLIRGGFLTPALSSSGVPHKPAPLQSLEELARSLAGDRADR